MIRFRFLQWSVRFPEGEEVLVIALGRTFLAAATSLGVLRIFSLAGVQVSCISLTFSCAALFRSSFVYPNAPAAALFALVLFFFLR